MHELIAQMVGLLDGESLTIDTHHGFGVRLAKMYPTVREINLQTISLTDVGTLIL